MLLVRIAIFGLLGIVALMPGHHSLPVEAAPAYDFSGVQATIQAQVDSGNFPGASLVLFKDGESIYEHHFGTFGPSTNISIASSTKWISGAVIMSLVDAGTIELDDTVSEYLPDWTGQKGTITIRQLMSHTSGLPADNACLGDSGVTLVQCVAAIRDAGLIAAPGSQFNYGGASMQVAGRIAEVATGKTWAQVFAEEIRTPLGMSSAFYWPLSNPQIGGGVFSTLTDYRRLMEMVLGRGYYNGQQLMAPSTVAEMELDQTAGATIFYTPHPDQRRYGIGVWRDVVDASGLATQVSSQGKWGMSPWIDRDRRYFGVFFVYDQLQDVYVLVAQIQASIRAVIDAYDTDGDGTGDGADPDDDNDGQADTSDGCPITPSTWLTPLGDADCDGYAYLEYAFPRAPEAEIGTVHTSKCSATGTISDEPLPDAWPPDFNDNQLVNGADILHYNAAFGQPTTNPPVNIGGTLIPLTRFDLNGSGLVNGADVLQLNPFFGKRCNV